MQRTQSNPTATTSPRASVPRMIFSPILRVFRLLHVPLPTNIPTSPTALLSPIIVPLIAKAQRLNLSVNPRVTLTKLSKHKFTVTNTAPYVFMVSLALLALHLMTSTILKIFIPIAYITAVILPITSQFFWPATPVLSWVLTFFCARFIPSEHRPNIHVALLPTLESVFYGANISDILTRFTHPVLDIVAWLPYGVGHFVIPFVVAALLWVFGPKGAVQYWAKAFGFLNLFGVLIQLAFPCAAPWYEIIHGLTPADYSMPGSPGGLMRIDRIFGTNGYTNAFGNAPLVFGAFPSLHSAAATISGLFLTHFFPRFKPFYWVYVGTLYWATMYLTHHYLIDVTAGACLAVCSYYYFMPEAFKVADGEVDWERAERYELVNDDLDMDEEIRKLERGDIEEEGEDGDIGGSGSGSKSKRSVSWGDTKVMGQDAEQRV